MTNSIPIRKNLFRTLFTIIASVLPRLVTPSTTSYSIVKGDTLAVPLLEKKDGRVATEYYLEGTHATKGFKIHNIVDNFQKVDVTATEPTCSESGIFRYDFSLVWKICDSKSKFIVTKYDKSFKVPTLTKTISMDKQGGKFLDGTSTEDDEHFVVMLEADEKIYFQLYSFKTGLKIHEIYV